MQVRTVSELVADSHGKTWGMRAGTYLEDYIKETDSKKYQKLFSKSVFHLDENEQIINDVRKGKHVYIDWRSNLQYIMRREYLKTDTCDFALSVEEFMEEQIAVSHAVNNLLTKIFSSAISTLFR